MARELRRRHAATSAGWSCVLASSGLTVWCAGVRLGASQPYRLSALQGVVKGVVLGKVFASGAGAPWASCSLRTPAASQPLPARLDEPASARLLQGGGRGLVEHCWGRYVALWQDPSGTHVLRDPSAGLPCLMIRYGGVTVIFSSMEEVLPLGLPPLAVNWDFILASVCRARQHTHGTGLLGVLQVLGGERVTVRGPALERAFLWNPLQIARQAPIVDRAFASGALRAAVRDAVHAWAGSYRGLLLSLSGGLDSSIVLAALRDAPVTGKLTCFHDYAAGNGIDERPAAREAARAAGVAMIERCRNPQLSFEPLTAIRAAHQPSASYLYHLEHGRCDAQLATEHGADVVVTGWGGDRLFFQDHALWAAADYSRRKPFSPWILQRALDCARMDQISVLRVLGESLQQHVSRRDPRAELLRHRPLLAPEALAAHASSGAFLHPLLRQSGKTPLGKLWHLQQLLAGPWEFHDPLGEADDPESLAPLYSQPVIEVCLRICTDLLVEGGWPRGMARRAFMQDLPGSIISKMISRQHKGGIEDPIERVLRHNMIFVRELLLDGELVRQGMLVRGRLEQALSGNAHRLQISQADLLEYLGIELWLRAWQQPQAQPGGPERKEQAAVLC